MKPKLILVLLTLVAVPAAAGKARAQLFGNRPVRSTPLRRARPGMDDVGTVTGNERFVRGNRRGTDFVGTDSRDRRDFVGMQQGDTSGQIRSAITGLRPRSGPDANRTQRQPARRRTEMYDPRLKVNFAFSQRPSQQIASDLIRRLESSLAIDQTGWIEVSLEGEKATLRGEVASERDRALARLLVLFEPGISVVQNDLTVKAPPPSPGGRRPPGHGPQRPDDRR